MQLYVIYDKLAEESGPVFEAKNDAVARRSFLRTWAEKGAAPEEFRLLRLGTIDHQTQTIRLEDVPEEVSLSVVDAVRDNLNGR